MRTASRPRPRRLAARIALLAWLPMAGCDDGGLLPLSVPGTDPVGAPCGAGSTCAGGLCLDYPGGYCSQACGTSTCPTGTVCRARDVGNACHKVCAAASDCRMGYQCFDGACVPACTTDGDCGAAYVCSAGKC